MKKKWKTDAKKKWKTVVTKMHECTLEIWTSTGRLMVRTPWDADEHDICEIVDDAVTRGLVSPEWDDDESPSVNCTEEGIMVNDPPDLILGYDQTGTLVLKDF